MPAGQGKYDVLCTFVREGASAQAAAVIIVGGSLGDGFSVQTRDPAFLRALPKMLEFMAREIRASLAEDFPEAH